MIPRGLPNVLLSIALLVATGAAQASTFNAKVIAVLDGDTLLVAKQQRGEPVKLRLAEIDAPEVAHAGTEGQPYGAASQKSLTDMVMGKRITVESRAVDDYGRIVAVVFVDDLNVNREQVRRGYAWEYTRFHANKELMALQREAQAARQGMWAGNSNVEPSQWRKQHPSTYAASSATRSSVNVAPDECGNKHCSAFKTCMEAKHYFERCGGKQLDGDGDGRPCESLCVGGVRR